MFALYLFLISRDKIEQGRSVYARTLAQLTIFLPVTIINTIIKANIVTYTRGKSRNCCGYKFPYGDEIYTINMNAEVSFMYLNFTDFAQHIP